MSSSSRRRFLKASAASLSLLGVPARGAAAPQITQVPELAGKLGLVSASLTPHIVERPKGNQFSLLDFPKVLRNDLDLTVADLNTMNFPSMEPAYVELLKTAIDAARCEATNLKMNQRVNVASADASERAEAMSVYKKSIDAAWVLGCRWVRPLPRAETPDRDLLMDSFEELIDYAGELGITVLIENFGWMMDDPDSVIDLADALGKNRVAIGPDTGNWASNEIRYSALEKTFPRAVTCDFKAKPIDGEGNHPAYDLKRCFDLGWDAGFRGPWCFEHGHQDLETAFRGIAFLRESVRKWTKEKLGPEA